MVIINEGVPTEDGSIKLTVHPICLTCTSLVRNLGDGGGGSSFAFGLASKAGSMGAKMGKKAAQSETGRRATKAAVKGACDGVRDDMLSKYSDSPTPTTPTSPVSPTPKESSKSSAGGHKKEEKNNVPAWMDSDDDDDEPRHMTGKVHRYHEPKPPKPSLKDKFKLNIGRSAPQKQAPRPRRPKDPKDRIYNSRLAKAPDWDKMLKVQALYNFSGEMKCDLQFRRGQVIKVMTRTDSHNDWWEGELEDRVGIFPANYVRTM